MSKWGVEAAIMFSQEYLSFASFRKYGFARFRKVCSFSHFLISQGLAKFAQGLAIQVSQVFASAQVTDSLALVLCKFSQVRK